jgi:hypothetical protein
MQKRCPPCRKANRKVYQKAYLRAWRQSPEGKANERARLQTPNRKAQKKAYLRAWRQSPEGKARQRARWQSPEGKAHMRAYKRAWSQNQRAALQFFRAIAMAGIVQEVMGGKSHG